MPRKPSWSSRSIRVLPLALTALTMESCVGTNDPFPRAASEREVRITLLTTPGCGQTDAAIDQVEAVADRLGIRLLQDRVLVETTEDAQRLHFLGSPTILVEGRDLDPSARDRTHFGLG